MRTSVVWGEAKPSLVAAERSADPRRTSEWNRTSLPLAAPGDQSSTRPNWRADCNGPTRDRHSSEEAGASGQADREEEPVGFRVGRAVSERRTGLGNISIE